MDFNVDALIRFVHIFGAVLWLGAGLFFLRVINPAVKAAGPQGAPVMMNVLKNGGLVKSWFLPISTITILAGLYLYVSGGWHTEPFGTSSGAMLTLGMVAGLVAYGLALGRSWPTENRMRSVVAGFGPEGPTPEQAGQMQGLAAVQEKNAKMAVGFLLFAIIGMAAKNVFV